MLIYFYFEGDYDEIFLRNIINPIFDDSVTLQMVTYASDDKSRVNGKLRSTYSLRNQGNTDIIYFRDSDFNNRTRSITDVKDEIIQDHNVEKNDIIIVIIEIESWYYAGLTPENCRNLGIPIFPDANKVDKESLKIAALKRRLTLKELLLEIIEYFDIIEAQNNNDSFRHFRNMINTRFSDVLSIKI